MRTLRKKAEKKVLNEYRFFKRRTIYRLSNRKAWDLCHKIHFYCCIKEYFELKDRIPAVYLELVLAEPSFLEYLWSEYLKREDTHFHTWDEIDNLLERVFMDWKRRNLFFKCIS